MSLAIFDFAIRLYTCNPAIFNAYCVAALRQCGWALADFPLAVFLSLIILTDPRLGHADALLPRAPVIPEWVGCVLLPIALLLGPATWLRFC